MITGGIHPFELFIPLGNGMVIQCEKRLIKTLAVGIRDFNIAKMKFAKKTSGIARTKQDFGNGDVVGRQAAVECPAERG